MCQSPYDARSNAALDECLRLAGFNFDGLYRCIHSTIFYTHNLITYLCSCSLSLTQVGCGLRAASYDDKKLELLPREGKKAMDAAPLHEIRPLTFPGVRCRYVERIYLKRSGRTLTW